MTVTSAISPIDSASQLQTTTAIAAKQAMRFTSTPRIDPLEDLSGTGRRVRLSEIDVVGSRAAWRVGPRRGPAVCRLRGVVRGASGDPVLVVFSRVLNYLAILVARAARSARPGLKSRPACIRRCTVVGQSMVARIGFSATTSRESRQGRKAAAAAAMSGAGARAGASYLPRAYGDLLRSCRVHSCAIPRWRV